jgi:putative transposase
MLLERVILVSYETIRQGALKFGADHPRRLRRKESSRADIWRLAEVVTCIRGEKRDLWRALNQDGYVLDEIARIHRNTIPARRLLTTLLSKQGRLPKRIVTDMRVASGAAKREVMPNTEDRGHNGFNSQADISRVPRPDARR